VSKCFFTKIEIDKAMALVRAKSGKIIEGPVERTGAKGALISFYFRDPDNNLINLLNHYLW